MGLVGEPASSADTIIYTQIMLRESGIAFVIPAVVILSLGVFGYCLKHGVADDRSFVMFMVPLLPTLYILFVVSQTAIGDQRLFHQSNIRVRNSVYNLATYNVGQITAYECDALGIVCQVIYRGGSIASLEYKPECMGPPQWDTTEDTVSLVVMCKTVFTHRVPS